MRIKFIGDVMLGELMENYRRGVRTFVERGGDPFAFCKEDLRDADLCVANLECVLSDRSDKSGFLREILRAPRRFGEILRDSGISAVNTANNHTLDHGDDALADTLDALQAAGIKAFGRTPSESFQREPLVWTTGGQSVGLLGYNLANFDSPRFAETVTAICAVVRAAKPRVSCLVLSLHWGQEYVHLPEPSICGAAERFFASGCDIIHGHHSHRLQGVLMEKNKLFAPSLGNFVFDDRRRNNRLTAVLSVELGPSGLESLEVHPYFINRHFQPVPDDRWRRDLVRLNRGMETIYRGAFESDRARLARKILRTSAVGHLINRVRLRCLILLHLHHYLPHLSALWRLQRRKGKREFSVTDS